MKIKSIKIYAICFNSLLDYHLSLFLRHRGKRWCWRFILLLNPWDWTSNLSSTCCLKSFKARHNPCSHKELMVEILLFGLEKKWIVEHLIHWCSGGRMQGKKRRNCLGVWFWSSSSNGFSFPGYVCGHISSFFSKSTIISHWEH